jgi:hypothetical protein
MPGKALTHPPGYAFGFAAASLSSSSRVLGSQKTFACQWLIFITTYLIGTYVFSACPKLPDSAKF